MNRNFFFLLTLFCLIVLSISCGWIDNWMLRQSPCIDFRQIESAPSTPLLPAQKPLRLVVASVSVTYETVHLYRTIADYLSQKLGRPVVVIQKQSYAEINLLLDRMEADLAFVSPGEYAYYLETGQHNMELLVMEKRNGTTDYQSLIVVNQASDIYSLNDLRGKTFAFTDPMSFSGHLGALYLIQHKTGATEDPDSFFSRYMFTYSFSKSLQAVTDRIVDGAAINSVVYESAQRRDPALVAAVRILAVSPKVPTGSIVVRRNLDSSLKELLRNSFLGMSDDPAMTTALHSLSFDGFVPIHPDTYDIIRNMLREMRTEK